MKCFVALLALVCLCEARPSNLNAPRATFLENIDNRIIGGTNAAPGQWPWQLSQQRGGGSSWGHSCGASLINARYGLSAAHCVDGAAVNSIRVVAGLNDRSNEGGTQAQLLNGYKMHESYNNNQATFAHDIAILTFQNNFNLGGNVQAATLPPNNNNNFAGTTCVITGWGRADASNNLPNILQQADVVALSTGNCVNILGGGIWDNHLCVSDPQNYRGACSGDSGGPANCQTGTGYQVAGVTSFVLVSNGNCLTNLPSVYTRVSTYLGWIQTNTP